MNIFALHRNYQKAAEMHCNKHVVKMVLETAQILCVVLHKQSVGIYKEIPYKYSHLNHPCTLWAGYSYDNFSWLLNLGLALSKEYTYRYGKKHKSENVLLFIKDHIDNVLFLNKGLTDFVQAVPEDCKQQNSVQAYRTYYCRYKKHFAVWSYRETPRWFNN